MTAATATAIEPWTPVPAGIWGALKHTIRPYVGASFIVPGDPAPKERRIGSGRNAFTPPRTVAAEKAVRAAFKQALPGWTPEPDRTYGMLVEFRTRSKSRTDCDNGTKLILDALNKTFWLDDVQVGNVFVDLVRRGEPGTQVWLFAVEPNGTTPTRLCECGTRYRSDDRTCGDCKRRRAIVNALLADDDSAADAAGQLRRDRSAVFSYITACMIGSNASPSIPAIARHITGIRGEQITEHRVRAVVDTLTADQYLAKDGRRLKILKPLGGA